MSTEGGESVEPVEAFQARARAWLAAHAETAPRDYGAICPPDLVEAGLAWQQSIHAAGFAGIHWPVEYGGQGLTIEHNAAWMLECALANVPPVLNMVGLVLTGGALLRFGTDEQKARHLAYRLSKELGYTIVTGGAAGVMEAAVMGGFTVTVTWVEPGQGKDVPVAFTVKVSVMGTVAIGLEMNALSRLVGAVQL